MTIEEKIWKHVDKTESCWLWTGPLHKTGYACIYHKRKFYYVHRLVKEWSLNRSISAGLECCHSCNNKSCVNPDHIREDTRSSNIIDNVVSGNHNTVKLTTECVKTIRKMISLGRSDKEIAEDFNVSRRNINDIRNYQSWKFVR